MATRRLTKTAVEGVIPAKADTYVWDGALTGFGAKITPSGSRIYLVQYRPKAARKTRRYTIGRHGSPWTTETAREAATQILARVRLGEDPFVADTDRRRAEAKAVLAAKAARAQAESEAFHQVVDEFIERYAKPRNRCWRDAQRVLRTAADRGWRNRPVSSLKRRDVLQLIDQAAVKSPASARTLFAHLRKFFSWCVERLYIEVSPCQGVRSPGSQVTRDRCLSDSELKLVWDACGQLGWPFGPMYRVLALTAQRRGEVSGMKWSEIDIEAAEWTIPAERAKNGRAHRVDLAPAVLDILRELKAREGLVPTAGMRVLTKSLMLTARGRQEVKAISWSELDLDKLTWTVPAARASTGRTRKVEFSGEAAKSLRALKSGNGLVFSTNGETGSSGHSKAKARLDDLVEAARAQRAVALGVSLPEGPLAPWRLHDLRRTAATGMARLGYPPHVIEAVLNHSSGVRGGLVAVYQHYDHRPERKAALTAWAEYVSNLGAGSP